MISPELLNSPQFLLENLLRCFMFSLGCAVQTPRAASALEQESNVADRRTGLRCSSTRVFLAVLSVGGSWQTITSLRRESGGNAPRLMSDNLALPPIRHLKQAVY